MAGVRDIIDMCKAGEVQEAYELAKADMEFNSTDPWEQQKVGCAF